MAIKRSEEEVLNQLTKYADGITVFSFGQSVALALAIGENKEIAKNIAHTPCIANLAIAISLIVYSVLIWFCHRSENSLTADAPDSAVAKAIRTTRGARYVVLILAAAICFLMIHLASQGQTDHAASGTYFFLF